MNKQSTISNQQLAKSGAALLITMLLIAGVGALALAVARIVLSEIRISGNYADSIVAYEAAEAGIEKGLLEFRYNRNIEGDTSNNTSFHKDLANDGTYDLDISYKDQDGEIGGTLDKDDSIELDISQNSQPISIEWNGDSGWVEWRVLGDTAEWDTIPDIPDPNNPTPYTSGSGSISPIIVSGSRKILRIKYLSQEGNDAKISYTITSSEPLDTGVTKVESVGTYGKTRRKLVAEIDRKSGAILGIFDYTLYTGEGDIRD